MAEKREIEEFWQWFQGVSHLFGERFENQELINELDSRIGQLGAFSWEIGPGIEDDRNSSLVLTPGGDPDLLSETRDFVRVAPVCPGWEFYPAKPPKKWQREFILEDEHGNETLVDASGARYVMFKYPDGLCDLLLADRNLAELPESLRQAAADILLDGELGEEERMAMIHSIEVVPAFDDTLQQKSSPIAFLCQHLQENRQAH